MQADPAPVTSIPDPIVIVPPVVNNGAPFVPILPENPPPLPVPIIDTNALPVDGGDG